MCCGIPPDLYDVVIIGEGAAAFAAVFVARERGSKVGLVLSTVPPPEVLDVLGQFELTVIVGRARRDAEDDHYLDIEGRLIYGARVIDTLKEHRTADGALGALIDAQPGCARAG